MDRDMFLDEEIFKHEAKDPKGFGDKSSLSKAYSTGQECLVCAKKLAKRHLQTITITCSSVAIK